jgi:5-methylcytosine-specific restriction endonuclease McrA
VGVDQAGRVATGSGLQGVRRTRSEEVDHITPLSQGGDPYDMNGLQGICVPCHQAKTAAENQGEGYAA